MQADATPRPRDLSLGLLASAFLRVESIRLGVVKSFDGSATPPRAVVDLATKGLRPAKGGGLESFELGPISAPVAYLGGGGSLIRSPLTAGDYVFVFLCSGDEDNALGTGEVNTDPRTTRRHDLLDAIVVPLDWRSSALASVDGGLVIEDEDMVQLGAGASAQLLTTATKVLARLNLLENAFNDHIHTGVTSGVAVSGTPDTPVGVSDFGHLEADRVKVRVS